MSDAGLTVPGMTELPRRYDVTITVDRDGGDDPNPAEFAAAHLAGALDFSDATLLATSHARLVQRLAVGEIARHALLTHS